MIFVCVFLLIIVSVLIYKLYQYSIIILDLEESIEDSLDVLNERYISLGKILEKEIFFDSVEVRQAVADIKASHDSIIRVANIITKNTKQVEEIETKESNQD